jgi:hypothetical protein
MENFLEYTYDEDAAVMLIGLDSQNIEYRTTSYSAQGHVVLKIDITPIGKNPLTFGYELKKLFDVIKEYIVDDRPKFGESFEMFKENWIENSTKYKKKYDKKIAKIKPLFEIECPQYELFELPNGEKVRIEYETDLIMDDEDYKKMISDNKRISDSRIISKNN